MIWIIIQINNLLLISTLKIIFLASEKRYYSVTTSFIPFENEKYTSGELFMGGQRMKCYNAVVLFWLRVQAWKKQNINCKH